MLISTISRIFSWKKEKKEKKEKSREGGKAGTCPRIQRRLKRSRISVGGTTPGRQSQPVPKLRRGSFVSLRTLLSPSFWFSGAEDSVAISRRPLNTEMSLRRAPRTGRTRSSPLLGPDHRTKEPSGGTARAREETNGEKERERERERRIEPGQTGPRLAEVAPGPQTINKERSNLWTGSLISTLLLFSHLIDGLLHRFVTFVPSPRRPASPRRVAEAAPPPSAVRPSPSLPELIPTAEPGERAGGATPKSSMSPEWNSRPGKKLRNAKYYCPGPASLPFAPTNSR